MQILNYRFKPKLIPTLATVLILPILINLGLWQSNKADIKQKLQDMYDQRASNDLIHIGGELLNVEELRYSPVEARGYYEPAYQILLDNQIYKGQAGYHVITPLHISGSNLRVLVNRGWVPVGADRNILPVIDTPQNEVEISGIVHDPSGKYMELAHTAIAKNSWQKVWQNLDLKIYKNLVPFPLQPFTILMDSTNLSGGYIRYWPKPNTGLEVNRGYAVQWYLMSIALVIIYIVTNFKKVSLEDNKTNG
jgi:surfeit locus 1 family protein